VETSQPFWLGGKRWLSVGAEKQVPRKKSERIRGKGRKRICLLHMEASGRLTVENLERGKKGCEKEGEPSSRKKKFCCSGAEGDLNSDLPD